MTIKTTNVFGQFSYAIEAEVSDAQRDVLAGLGLLQVLQRTPASKAEKEMAGYEKRPDNFKRGEIPFNEKNAAILKKALESAVLDLAQPGEAKNEQGLAIEAVVSLYVPNTSEAKFVEEKALWTKRKGEGKLAVLATNVGYTGNLEEAGEAPKAFLGAIRAAIKVRMEVQKASM